MFGCLPIGDLKIVLVDIQDNVTNEISSSVKQVDLVFNIGIDPREDGEIPKDNSMTLHSSLNTILLAAHHLSVILK